MKKRYILMLIGLLLMLTGCQRQDLNSAYKVTDRITKYMKNDNPDLSTLNSKEKRIYNKVIDEYKKENYVIDLSKIKTIDASVSEDAIDTSNDSKVYEENGDYKIKYTDINWYDTDDTEYFMANAGGKRVEVYKDLVPILYEDTKDNINYSYKYMNYKIEDGYTYFYYKSVADYGGLTFIVNNKNIEDMTLRFSDTYEGVDVSDSNTKGKLIEAMIIVICVLTAFIVGILILYNKTNEKEDSYY